MMKSTKASVGAIALALGGLALTCAAGGPDQTQRAGAKAAAKAARALAEHDGGVAVTEAERAVALAPGDAAYRMMLGQSYLQAGRFASAREAFADTLQLDPANGRAALNLALAQTALGDWQAAQRTLVAHSGEITPSDRGLALALAGDTSGAIALLTSVARSPAATAKTRQNLALAYALAGQWQQARVVAAADMSPADVDARLEQWASFAQPKGAADQVASLMGVHPARADLGQPAALALNAPTPVPPGMAPAPVGIAAAVPAAPVAVAVVSPGAVVFGPRHEVVQAMPAALIAPAPGRYKIPAMPVRSAAAWPSRAAGVAAAPAKAGGRFVVQLGAYANMVGAKHAWSRAARQVAGFAGHRAQGVSVRTTSATLFRLSVGGFSRGDADQLCHQYRAHGGECFVRAAAGDQLARWDASDAKVAARDKRVEVASR